jgi:hypothetical protein
LDRDHRVLLFRRRLDKDEQRIIDFIERVNGGRKLTQQEINLSLEQARAIGEL